jgi:hypothetical protein
LPWLLRHKGGRDPKQTNNNGNGSHDGTHGLKQSLP